ncbi:MAG: xanthine dehydrogenase family protein molybdopterin-binding subunit [Candidatus Aminicenantes bacterium]|nr:xanthine dehydrogenase family protein molybdopterin-binding subunit [Candidatus Aminicenantes bacterium]
MSMTRRQFIASLGGTGLFYTFRFSHGAAAQTKCSEPLPLDPGSPDCPAVEPVTDYTEWIAFGADGKVTVFTGRTELGQGLKTVITAIVTQGLEIEQADLTVIQGDTDCCPDDGVTSGSSATRIVGWGFWLACEKIRADLMERASRFLRIPLEKLEFRECGVGRKGEKSKIVDAAELGGGERVVINIDPHAAASKVYEDRGIPNVNAEGIVTGALKYAGDLHKPGMLYAGWLTQPYHRRLTKLEAADMEEARSLPGVEMVDIVRGRVAAVGERYTAVRKALAAVKPTWMKPARSKELPLDEARANAALLEIKEEQGSIETGLRGSDIVLSETYTTHYISHAQLETDTALAQWEDGGRVTVWVGTQHAHKVRELAAAYLNRPLADVRVVAVPVGGAFGGRQANPVCREAAGLAEKVGAPVKLVYSRKNQFQLRSMYKAACIIEVTGGISSAGKIIARKIDSYQDVGDGTKNTYDIPNVLVKAYRVPDWPVSLAAVRGTSYVQTCFATESHMDMLAHNIGKDPLVLRKENLSTPAFANLIDACADKIGYGRAPLDAYEGIGLAIVLHGGCQLGAIAAKIAVDRVSGKISVKHVCVAFDIGTVINCNTVTQGIRGGVAWGIGYALTEEIRLDGHSTQTEYFSQYRIARFSDMPPIDIAFLDNHLPGTGPRGCGEMPVIPTIGAIANAFFNATGVRLYTTPFTPERVKKALGIGI